MPANLVSGRQLIRAIGVWIAVFGSSAAAVLVLLRLFRVALLEAHRADVLALLMIEGYVVLLAALLLSFGGLRGLGERLGFRYTSAWGLLLAPALWFGTLITAGVLSIPLQHWLGRAPDNTARLLNLGRDPVYLALVIPTVAVLGPAVEEMFFRGALFGWLRTRVPVPVAAVVSAAIFAGAHLTPLLFPYLFLFGLVAAYLYQVTGSTLNSFVMHFCQNSLALATYALISRGTG